MDPSRPERRGGGSRKIQREPIDLGSDLTPLRRRRMRRPSVDGRDAGPCRMCDAMADAHAVTRAPRDPESETDEVTRGWSRAPTPCAVLASVDPISDLASGGDARVVRRPGLSLQVPPFPLRYRKQITVTRSRIRQDSRNGDPSNGALGSPECGDSGIMFNGCMSAGPQVCSCGWMGAQGTASPERLPGRADG